MGDFQGRLFDVGEAEWAAVARRSPSGPRFRPCMQGQPMLLPPDVGELVPEGSTPRVVDMMVRSIDRSTLTSLYPGGGAPAHDPQMMLKVVIRESFVEHIHAIRSGRGEHEFETYVWDDREDMWVMAPDDDESDV